MTTKTKDINFNINDFSINSEVKSASNKTAVYIDGITQNDVANLDMSIIDNCLVITDPNGKNIKLSNYKGIKYIKTDKDGKNYKLTDIISYSYVDNTANEIKTYHLKKLTVSGTNYNDKIDLSESGYQPTGSKNIRNNKGLTISGDNGDDNITGTIYNDTITGGTGKTIINYSKGFGHDVINLTKGENFTLKFDNTLTFNDLIYEYTNKNKDLKISYNNNEGSITLKNFASKNVTNNANAKKGIVDSSSVELIIDNITYDLRSNQKDGEYWYEIKPTGNFTGGWLNDHINAKNTDEIKDKKNNHVDIVLKGGAGDDLIESSMSADKITGGVGHNTIKYTSLDQLSGDKVYLTKGEKLDIDISEMAGATATYRVNKNDLIVYVHYSGKTREFTIINFGTKDITNNTTKNTVDNSYVKLITSTDPNGIDLRKDIEVVSDSGTYHNDIINKSTYDVWYDKKKTQRSNNWSKTGLTIKGGAGDDTITGTDYSDKIYGNTGTDTINAGTGNNYIYFNKGDGHDIIENGNGIDTLVFAKKTQLSYSYDKYDLIIKYSDKDTVTLKDYLKGHSVKFVQIGKNRTLFNPEKPKFNEYDEGEYHVIEGTAIEDTIVGTYNNDKIFGNDGDDNIDARKGADIIDGGTGNNTYTFVSGDGQDTIINGDGNDTIEFPDAQNITYSKALESNDLIIGYGNNDSITLKDYFVNNSHSTKTILNGNTELNISEEVAKGYNLIGTESAETFDGTTDIPFTYVVNGGNDIIQNSKNTDTIKINTQETLSYSKLSNSDDLVITYGDHNITIKGYFANDSSIQKLLNNTQELNIANEIKKNIYIYSNGYEDTINFSAPQNLSYSRYLDSNDLVINYGNESKITLKDFFINNYHSVQKIINGDETLYIKDINATFYFNDDQTLKIYKSPNEFDLCIDVEIIKNEEKNISTYILRNFLTGNNVIKNIKHGNDIFDLNTIIDYDTTCIISGGNNTFSGGCIIKGDPSDIIDAYHYPAYMSGYDLILGGLTLKNYFKNDEYPIDTIIRYYNEHSGSEWIATSENISLKEYLSYMTIRTDVGENTNDILPGKEKCNIFYYFKEGDGDDTILNYDGYSNLLFDPGTKIKLVKGLNDDLILLYSDYDSITLKDFFQGKSFPTDYYIYGDYDGSWSGSGPTDKDGLYIYGTNENDTIYLDKDYIFNFYLHAGDGDDKIIIPDTYKESYNGYRNRIYGDKGNDFIDNQSTKSCFYVFNIGDGIDTISYNHKNQIANIKPSYISFSDCCKLNLYRSYNNLIIKYSKEDEVILEDFFAPNRYYAINSQMNPFFYHPVESIYNGNSYLIIKDQLDVIYEYGTENRTFYFGIGNSNNIIYSGEGEDTIIFNYYAVPKCYHYENDLILQFDNNIYGHQVVLKNYFTTEHSVKYIEYRSSNYGITRSNISKLAINLDIDGLNLSRWESYKTNIYANSDNNTYNYSVSNNNLYVIQDNGGNDTLKINNQLLSDFKIFFNLCNVSEDGNYYEYGDNLYFVSDYDYLKSSSTLSGSIYEITKGVKIKNYFTEDGKIETIIDKNGILFNNDNIEAIAKNVASWLTSDGREYTDVYSVLSNGDLTEINELLSYFNDFEYSSSTNHIYVFNIGDGKKTIVYNPNGVDVIKFNEETNLQYCVDKYDLIISYSENDIIRLKDYFLYENFSVHTIYNANMPITISEELPSTLILGGNNNVINDNSEDNIIYANNNDNTIYIGNGNDVIYPMQGNDKIIINGSGQKTICIDKNYANDTVIQGIDKCDALVLYLEDYFWGGGIRSVRNGKDLAIYYNISDNEIGIQAKTITIKDYYLLETDSYKADFVSKIYLNGLSPYPFEPEFILNSNEENDYTITITNGRNIVIGSDNSDKITAEGSYKNLIFTGAGDDIIHTGVDSGNTIYVGAGNDTVYIEGDINNIYGYTYVNGTEEFRSIISPDNDVYLDYGNNTVIINSTSGGFYDERHDTRIDKIYIKSTSGNDKLVVYSRISDISKWNEKIELIFEDKISYTRDGKNLVINRLNDNDDIIGTFTINSYFNLSVPINSLKVYSKNGSWNITNRVNYYGTEFNRDPSQDFRISGKTVIYNGNLNDLTLYYNSKSVLVVLNNDIIPNILCGDDIQYIKTNDSYLSLNSTGYFYDTKTNEMPTCEYYYIQNGDIIIGTEGKDTLYGTDENDIIYGDNSIEYVTSGRFERHGGDDGLRWVTDTVGYTETDTIYANGGDDIIYSGLGASIIYAGDGDDIIYTTGSGNNIYAGNGHNIVYGGSSYDYYHLFKAYNDNTSFITHEDTTIIDTGNNSGDEVIIHRDTTDNKINIWFNINKNGLKQGTFYISDLVGNKANICEVEKIYIYEKNGFEYSYDYNNDELIQNVVSWLNQNNKSDVQSVMNGNDQNAQLELFAIFDDYWVAK